VPCAGTQSLSQHRMWWRAGRRRLGFTGRCYKHPVWRAWQHGAMLISLYEGPRKALRPLFRLADDSEREIDGYLGEGDVLVAVDGGQVVGHLQLVAREPGVVELTSMAVVEGRRGEGTGRALVEAAVQRCREHGSARLLVATAAAGTGSLRFYQRQGFRMLCIERDAFGVEAGYAEDIVIDGIPCGTGSGWTRACEPSSSLCGMTGA
jgi:GNAT superfamily N-acetyltransferase